MPMTVGTYYHTPYSSISNIAENLASFQCYCTPKTGCTCSKIASTTNAEGLIVDIFSFFRKKGLIGEKKHKFKQMGYCYYARDVIAYRPKYGLFEVH